MIQLSHVSKIYPPNTAALQDINLQIAKGELVFLAGPSGAGKTTLLKLLFREEEPSKGRIIIHGKDVTQLNSRGVARLRQQMGLVFQEFKFLPHMEPRGQGALYLAFEQLKKRLSAEGLFAEARKKALPFLPASIGIVTSEKGAALRDMLRIIADRYPDRRIVVRSVRVQGEGAAREIASGITDLGGSGHVDVMIVGRGGGSLEDLWAFNEEIVARSIFASPVPVISAVGHEIDFTIADFVADLRAPTPTAAAEVVVPKKSELVEQVKDLEEQLLQWMWRKLELAREDWSGFVKRLADPERKLRETQQQVDELSGDLVRRWRDRIRQLKDRLVQIGGRLDALSPLAVLDRGYSIAHKIPDEKLVKDTAALDIGDILRVTFAKGKAICRVERKE